MSVPIELSRTSVGLSGGRPASSRTGRRHGWQKACLSFGSGREESRDDGSALTDIGTNLRGVKVTGDSGGIDIKLRGDTG